MVKSYNCLEVWMPEIHGKSGRAGDSYFADSELCMCTRLGIKPRGALPLDYISSSLNF